MSDKLVEYMLELNSNPEALEAHNLDAESAARDFGLNEEDVSLIVAGDVEEIKKRCDSSPLDTSNAILGFFNQ